MEVENEQEAYYFWFLHFFFKWISEYAIYLIASYNWQQDDSRPTVFITILSISWQWLEMFETIASKSTRFHVHHQSSDILHIICYFSFINEKYEK